MDSFHNSYYIVPTNNYDQNELHIFIYNKANHNLCVYMYVHVDVDSHTDM